MHGYVVDRSFAFLRLNEFHCWIDAQLMGICEELRQEEVDELLVVLQSGEVQISCDSGRRRCESKQKP